MLPLLEIRNLSVDFVTGDQTTHAVQDVSFTVNRNEIVAIVGESGSGKSVSSLSIVQLLPSPPAQYPSGKILFSPDGNTASNLLAASTRILQDVRGNRIAMIFQEPMSSLNPVMTCGSQVTEAILKHRQIPEREARQQAVDWFSKVQLPDPQEMFHRYPHQLSGGQKQRVMIAMAMCCSPDLLICDEPTTALDVTVQQGILSLIRDLQQQQQMGVIFITHDLGVVSEIADRVLIMYKGRIVEMNDTASIFKRPEHPYTRALIACRPAMHPKGKPLPVVADFTGDPKGPERAIVAAHPPGHVLVDVQNLVVRFPGRSNILGRTTSWFTAVNDVSFQVLQGETLGLVGESGCGKTTLGRTMLQLIRATSGKIIYNNRDITRLTQDQLRKLRSDVQLVFQDPFSSLNPRLTIGAAIGEPLQVHEDIPAAARRKRVAELLDRVSLAPSMMNRYPHEFSGGQRQRIVIARALAMNPSLLVCDESVSALDVSVQAQVLNLLNELKRELGLTMLFISHDLSVVRYMSDRIMVMRAGEIVETGLAEEVYFHPKHAYTQRLLAAIPKV
ncbi:MAG TPA: ABC transporter ATP-binding protein [Flavisolibacter sp.]